MSLKCVRSDHSVHLGKGEGVNLCLGCAKGRAPQFKKARAKNNSIINCAGHFQLQLLLLFYVYRPSESGIMARVAVFSTSRDVMSVLGVRRGFLVRVVNKKLYSQPWVFPKSDASFKASSKRFSYLPSSNNLQKNLIADSQCIVLYMPKTTGGRQAPGAAPDRRIRAPQKRDRGIDYPLHSRLGTS